MTFCHVCTRRFLCPPLRRAYFDQVVTSSKKMHSKGSCVTSNLRRPFLT